MPIKQVEVVERSSKWPPLFPASYDLPMLLKENPDRKKMFSSRIQKMYLIKTLYLIRRKCDSWKCTVFALLTQTCTWFMIQSLIFILNEHYSRIIFSSVNNLDSIISFHSIDSYGLAPFCFQKLPNNTL